MAKGLTLGVVHEATKIPLDALRAIEEGYSIRMLTPFYYRGFIKIYAEFLGLNVAEVLKEYNLLPPKPVTKTSPLQPKPVLREPNILVVSLQECWRYVWNPRHRKRILQVIAVVVAVVVGVKLIGSIATFFKSRPKIVHVGNAHVRSLQKPVKKKELEEAPATSPISAISEDRRVTLTVHAPQNSWIQVKTDGEVVFEMTMKKGTIENWEAKKTIELSGKNISHLDLEVNGQHIGTLSSSNRRAKRVIITKEGLAVKK